MRFSAYVKMPVILLLGTSILPACSGSAAEDPPAPAAKDEPVELVFYSMSKDSVASFNERYGDAIRKKFPNYTIKYIQRGTGTDIQDLLNAGTRIDIHWDSIGSFPNSNIVNSLSYDMTDLVKKHNIDLSRFEPTLIDAVKRARGRENLRAPRLQRADGALLQQRLVR
ncbi:hypothetical protein LJK87_19015 [Paenibacillus sp. P25]|nr:hypothetical protein LJK87_19015 [Paenibacillus sp. P25]